MQSKDKQNKSLITLWLQIVFYINLHNYLRAEVLNVSTIAEPSEEWITRTLKLYEEKAISLTNQQSKRDNLNLSYPMLTFAMLSNATVISEPFCLCWALEQHYLEDQE